MLCQWSRMHKLVKAWRERGWQAREIREKEDEKKCREIEISVLKQIREIRWWHGQ